MAPNLGSWFNQLIEVGLDILDHPFPLEEITKQEHLLVEFHVHILPALVARGLVHPGTFLAWRARPDEVELGVMLQEMGMGIGLDHDILRI